MAKKSEYPWWIRERHNPQLGVYYIAEGQMSKTAARRHETGSRYGHNVMHEYQTEAGYRQRLDELRQQGASMNEILLTAPQWQLLVAIADGGPRHVSERYKPLQALERHGFVTTHRPSGYLSTISTVTADGRQYVEAERAKAIAEGQ